MSKSNKNMDLKSLIVLPRIFDNIISSQISTLGGGLTFKESNNDVIRIQQNAVALIDTNLKRLEKVRNRIIESSREGKAQVVIKIDQIIKFLKFKKPKASEIKSIEELRNMSNEILEIVKKNDVQIGHVFDNRKDGKKDKYYKEFIKNIHEFEKKLEQKSLQSAENLKKLVNKTYSIIDQLRNEEKYNKSKAETKSLRRELDKCFREMRIALK